jgi:hypothetical protein
VAVEQLTLVVFPAVTVEPHHLLAVQFQSAQPVVVVAVLQAVMVTMAVRVAVQDTHQHQAVQAMQAVTHHQKEATAVALALQQDFMQQAVVVVYQQPAQQVTAHQAVAMAAMDHQHIHHGVQQHRQDKMSAAHIGTPVVAVVEYSAVAA